VAGAAGSSIRDVLRDILRHEGPAVLLRGTLARVLTLAPGIYILKKYTYIYVYIYIYIHIYMNIYVYIYIYI